MELENLNPNVYKKSDDRKSVAADWDDNVDDPFDEREVFGKKKNSVLLLFTNKLISIQWHFVIVFLFIFISQI